MTLVRTYHPTFILGNGVRKVFPYLFEAVSSNFVQVIIKHSDNSTYRPVYSVDLEHSEIVLGDSEPAPSNTDVVCIYRLTPDLQDTPFRTLQGYDAKALDNILSKIVAMIQELKANGFSTQILQGAPWQLDLLQPADDSASVVIDYNARILKKGLYFQIVSGNLQVSADGNSFITMPKSTDIVEFRQNQIVLEDLTVIRKLQYRIGAQWFDADEGSNAAIDYSQQAVSIATNALDIATRADTKSDTALNYAAQAQTAVANIYSKRFVFTTTAGQSTLTFPDDVSDKMIDLYWNGQLISPTGNWTVSGNTINLLFSPESSDTIVANVGVITKVIEYTDLTAHNTDPLAHANLFNNIDCGVM